jgi:hypothetical protein
MMTDTMTLAFATVPRKRNELHRTGCPALNRMRRTHSLITSDIEAELADLAERGHTVIRCKCLTEVTG